MEIINESNIVKTIKIDEFSLPESVDFTCGFCSRLVNYYLDWNEYNGRVMFTTSRCSGCGGMSKFYLVEFMENSDDYYEGILYISPGSNRRKPIKGIESYPEFNKGLVRAYNSTINVFNLGEWTATSILCRRLLEGITKSILPETEQYRPLARQLEILPNKVDLDKPILTLAHAIRIGGNLGAHFDLEKEPNYETSKYMVDLLEYLIEYLFILPHRIKELNEHIENLKNEKIDSNP